MSDDKHRPNFGLTRLYRKKSEKGSTGKNRTAASSKATAAGARDWQRPPSDDDTIPF